MDGLWFVAAFIACVLIGSAIVRILEARDGRHAPGVPTPYIHPYHLDVDVDVPLPVRSRPALYDWDERGDFS
jgi:hypothetical protein